MKGRCERKKKKRGCQGEVGWFGGGMELVLGKEIKPSWKEGHLLVLWPWIMQISQYLRYWREEWLLEEKGGLPAGGV